MPGTNGLRTTFEVTHACMRLCHGLARSALPFSRFNWAACVGFHPESLFDSLRRKRGERELNIVLFVLMRFRLPVLPLWRVQTSTTGALVCRGSATREPMSGCGSTRGFGKKLPTQAKWGRAYSAAAASWLSWAKRTVPSGATTW
jgi:hypothetical protein